jgi:hypothetical protein
MRVFIHAILEVKPVFPAEVEVVREVVAMEEEEMEMTVKSF